MQHCWWCECDCLMREHNSSKKYGYLFTSCDVCNNLWVFGCMQTPCRIDHCNNNGNGNNGKKNANMLILFLIHPEWNFGNGNLNFFALIRHTWFDGAFFSGHFQNYNFPRNIRRRTRIQNIRFPDEIQLQINQTDAISHFEKSQMNASRCHIAYKAAKRCKNKLPNENCNKKWTKRRDIWCEMQLKQPKYHSRESDRRFVNWCSGPVHSQL